MSERKRERETGKHFVAVDYKGKKKEGKGEVFTLIVIVPRSFLSFIFSISSDGRSLSSISFGVSASSSINGNFTMPSRLSCPMSWSKTCLKKIVNKFASTE